MSWTAPRTWVTGEVVTSTIMNAHVRDNLLEVPARIEGSLNVTTSFTSGTLPTAFGHLLVVWSSFYSSRAAVEDNVYMRLNGDSSAVYNHGYTETLTATVSGFSAVGATYGDVGVCPGTHASVVSTLAGAGMFLVMNHRQGGGKSYVGLNVSYYGNTTASHRLRFVAGGWQSNSAVTSVTVACVNGNVVAGGRVDVYGFPPSA